MAEKASFKIKGAKRLEKMLLQLGPEISRRIGQTALRKAAAPIVDRAKELAPYEYGKLREGITSVSTRSTSDDALKRLVTVKGERAHIAHMVEEGTKHSAAHPFLRPAFDETAGEAIQILGDEIANGIVREVKRLSK